MAQCQTQGIYLWAYEDLHEVETALRKWLALTNHFKPHQRLPQERTPWQRYRPHDMIIGEKVGKTVSITNNP